MTALDPSLAGDIPAAVEQGFETQIAFTQDLIRPPSLRGQALELSAKRATGTIALFIAEWCGLEQA